MAELQKKKRYENPDRKGTTHLKRAQAKAHYNFHKRLRDAEEEKRLKEQLDSKSFDFDVNESPLVDKADVAKSAQSAKDDSEKGNK